MKIENKENKVNCELAPLAFIYGLFVMYLQIKKVQFQVFTHLQHSKMFKHTSLF